MIAALDKEKWYTSMNNEIDKKNREYEDVQNSL